MTVCDLLSLLEVWKVRCSYLDVEPCGGEYCFGKGKMFRYCQEKKMGSSFVVAAEESCGGVQVCGIEEIEAKWWMDGASKHIVDGRFQSALSLLRKAQQLCPTLKGLPELTAISQVCYAGSWRACSCSSRRELCQTPDWYRILEVSPFFSLPIYRSHNTGKKDYKKKPGA